MFSSGTVSFVSKLLCADTGRGCRLQLQRWVRRKREFVVNPPPIEQPEVDPREAARAELGELTGGMSFEELRSIIEPKASNIKELMSSETISSPTTSELTIGRRNEDLTPARLSSEASLPPTYNLAAYVEKCDPDSTLYRLLALGVNLHNIEKRKGLAQYVLGLRFEEDVQKHLWWLRDQQIPANMLGKWLTKNPLIFKVDLDDLQTRVNYLESKKFTPTQIQRILNNNPFWLMFSTRRIDRRLGFFQKEFQLRGDDVRFLASKQPNLITYNLEHIRKSTFVIREEMGFEKDEVTALLLNKPRLWMQSMSYYLTVCQRTQSHNYFHF